MLSTLNGGYFDAGKRILNALKTIDVSGWKRVKKRVAVVKFRSDKSVCQNGCRVYIKRRAGLSKLTDLVKRRAADVRDMVRKGKIRVKCNAKVSDARRRV